MRNCYVYDAAKGIFLPILDGGRRIPFLGYGISSARFFPKNGRRTVTDRRVIEALNDCCFAWGAPLDARLDYCDTADSMAGLSLRIGRGLSPDELHELYLLCIRMNDFDTVRRDFFGGGELLVTKRISSANIYGIPPVCEAKSGTHIFAMQQLLRERGFFCVNDGFYGNLTAKRASEFVRSHHGGDRESAVLLRLINHISIKTGLELTYCLR